MSKLIRFGVSMDEKLLNNFDNFIRVHKYANRSQGISDLVRASLVERDWRSNNKIVAAVISLVYDHHRRELVNKIMDIQHEFQKLVISTQHIHLDHDNCLEIIAAKGSVHEVVQLAHRLRAVKGIKHAALSPTTSGKELV